MRGVQKYLFVVSIVVILNGAACRKHNVSSTEGGNMKRLLVLFILSLLLACGCSRDLPPSLHVPVAFIDLQNLWGAIRIGELDLSTGVFASYDDSFPFIAENGFLRRDWNGYRFVFDAYGGNIYLGNGFEYIDFALYFQEYTL